MINLVGVYSDRLKKRGLRHGSGSKKKGGGGVLGTGNVKKGVLGTGQARKRGGGGLRHGSGKKGGSLLRHIRVLDIYASADPPGVDHHDHILYQTTV